MFTESDPGWFQYLRQPPQFLADYDVQNITSLTDLVAIFNATVAGAVVYDGSLPSLSLLASTAAGAEDLLPVCNRSNPSSPTIYDMFVKSALLPVRRTLRASMFPGNVTGSRKGDAYMWAIHEFIESNKSDAAVQGFYIDYYWTMAPACCGDAHTDKLMSTLSNHDWYAHACRTLPMSFIFAYLRFIARRGFFWDLDIWADEEPVDDPTQPLGTDLKVMQAIALAAYKQTNGNRMIHVGGFTPWAYKYVKPYGKHEGVETEWQTVKVRLPKGLMITKGPFRV
jgi:hypothetical protein